MRDVILNVHTTIAPPRTVRIRRLHHPQRQQLQAWGEGEKESGDVQHARPAADQAPHIAGVVQQQATGRTAALLTTRRARPLRGRRLHTCARQSYDRMSRVRAPCMRRPPSSSSSSSMVTKGALRRSVNHRCCCVQVAAACGSAAQPAQGGSRPLSGFRERYERRQTVAGMTLPVGLQARSAAACQEADDRRCDASSTVTV